MEFAKILGQILVAVVAAGLGAYYALSKTKRERLWVDRYEALRKVVLSLHTIQYHFEAVHLSSMGVSTLRESEETLLREASLSALVEVRSALSSLVLLFKPVELEVLFARHTALREAIINLNHSEPSDYQDSLGNVACEAEHAATAAAELGRRSW